MGAWGQAVLPPDQGEVRRALRRCASLLGLQRPSRPGSSPPSPAPGARSLRWASRRAGASGAVSPPGPTVFGPELILLRGHQASRAGTYTGDLAPLLIASQRPGFQGWSRAAS